MLIPAAKEKLVADTEALTKEYEQQYNDGLITQGEKYNKVVDAWAKCSEKVADEMMGRIKAVEFDDKRPSEADELDLHDEPLGRPWFADADASARRHARPDGQAVGRDHRDADHLELQGRPDRSRVLQLDPRRPQGSGRHRAEDGELGLPDAPSGRRGAGLHRQRGGLRHRQGPDHDSRSSMPVRWSPRSASASSAAPRSTTSTIRFPAI
jgi:hypothetical protein